MTGSPIPGHLDEEWTGIVADGGEPHRVHGVADVDEQAVASTGTSSQTDRGIHGDVVTLRRTAGLRLVARHLSGYGAAKRRGVGRRR